MGNSLSRSLRFFLIFGILVMSAPAFAQVTGTDTAPGDSCAGAPSGATRVVADPDGDGTRVTLICDGTTWNQEGIVVLSKTGAAPASGTSAAGSAGELQFNGGSGFSASSNLFWDSTNNLLRLDNDTGLGTSGCLRYNGSTSRIEFSHDCTAYSVFGEPVWSTGGGDAIYYNPTTPMVGIGVSSPSVELDVDGVIRASDYIVVNPAASPTTPNFLGLGDLSGVVLSSPSNGESLQFDGTNWVNTSGGGGLWTSGTGDDIYYNTGTPQVGIGNATPDVALDVTGDIEFTGVLRDVSDFRLKANINEISDDLEKVTSLRGVSFTMKDDPSNRVELGFIAQEVEEVYPMLVGQGEDGFKNLNYQGLIAPMIEAIKAQQQEIESLRAEVEALKAVQNSPNVRPVSVEGQ